MAGVLEFTLGLQAKEFLDNMGLGLGSVLSLEKAVEGLKATFEKVWSTIEKGAALKDLSKRSGESVATLFQLEKGFKAAGLGADGVAPALFQLNKSLGGVNELGESTADVFQKMGTSADALKKMGGAGAMTAILQAMSKMNQSSATKVGASIFGRGSAGDMVQLSRSMEEFQGAMKGAQAQAMVFQRVAAVFDAIEKAVGRVKAKLDPLFLVIAEHIAPALQKVLSMVENFDLAPLASGLGEAFDLLQESFKEGKLLDLLNATFSAAVEYFGNLLFGVIGNGSFWEGIWDVAIGSFRVALGVMVKGFLNLGTVLKSAIETAFNVVFEKLSGTKVGKFLGLENYKADSFGETYARNKADAAGANDILSRTIAGDGSRVGQGAAGIGQAFAQARANSGGPAQDALTDLINSLNGRLPRKGASKKTDGPGGDQIDLAGGKRPEATALEKMGFVFSGGPSNNHAATTASNTTKLVALAQQQIEIARGGKSAMTDALTNTHA